MKFKLGEKVVPFKKTADGRSRESAVYANACSNGQFYLYVVRTPGSGDYQEYGLGLNNNNTDYDYFHESDFYRLGEHEPESNKTRVQLLSDWTKLSLQLIESGENVNNMISFLEEQ